MAKEPSSSYCLNIWWYQYSRFSAISANSPNLCNCKLDRARFTKVNLDAWSKLKQTFRFTTLGIHKGHLRVVSLCLHSGGSPSYSMGDCIHFCLLQAVFVVILGKSTDHKISLQTAKKKPYLAARLVFLAMPYCAMGQSKPDSSLIPICTATTTVKTPGNVRLCFKFCIIWDQWDPKSCC